MNFFCKRVLALAYQYVDAILKMARFEEMNKCYLVANCRSSARHFVIHMLWYGLVSEYIFGDFRMHFDN